jgi:hypothetical protein
MPAAHASQAGSATSETVEDRLGAGRVVDAAVRVFFRAGVNTNLCRLLFAASACSPINVVAKHHNSALVVVREAHFARPPLWPCSLPVQSARPLPCCWHQLQSRARHPPVKAQSPPRSSPSTPWAAAVVAAVVAVAAQPSRSHAPSIPGPAQSEAPYSGTRFPVPQPLRSVQAHPASTMLEVSWHYLLNHSPSSGPIFRQRRQRRCRAGRLSRR